MTTLAFPATPKPVYGVSKSSNATVRESVFGSGYSQRTVFGLNQISHSLDLRWEYCSETEADNLEGFLIDREGNEAFTYQLEGESAASKYICKDWSKTLEHGSLSTITATFEQVFEPNT